jgi:hypothetical protein
MERYWQRGIETGVELGVEMRRVSVELQVVRARFESR